MPSTSSSDIRRNSKYDHLIPKIRQILQERLIDDQSQAGTYYDYDVTRAMKDDWQIRRFLLYHNGSVESTGNAIVAAYKFYKSNRLRDLKVTDFPAEAIEMGAVFLYEPDIDGRPTLYIRAKSHIPVKELVKTKIQMLQYLSLQVDDMAGINGFTNVVDLRNISMQNIDIDMSLALLSSKDHFPYSASRIIMVDLPFIARAAFHVVKYAMSAEGRNAIIHVSHKELTKYIDIDNMPFFLGGRCKRPYSGPSVVPKGCLSSAQYYMEVLNVTQERMDKIRKLYAPLLETARREQIDENFNMRNSNEKNESSVDSVMCNNQLMSK